MTIAIKIEKRSVHIYTINKINLIEEERENKTIKFECKEDVEDKIELKQT